MSESAGNGITPSIFTRHLEELEELQSGASSFEETPTYGDDDSSGEPSMEWRRQLLEEANTRVKQAKARPLDPSKVYEAGTLLFDAKDGKFGRVKSSINGYLVVKFVRGGEREYGKDPNLKGKRTRLRPNKSTKSKAPAKETTTKAKTAKSKRADIEDANTYIRENYKTMSNRELARQTGLSEHTIRRKLGEWGLKRIKS